MNFNSGVATINRTRITNDIDERLAKPKFDSTDFTRRYAAINRIYNPNYDAKTEQLRELLRDIVIYDRQNATGVFGPLKRWSVRDEPQYKPKGGTRRLRRKRRKSRRR